jgi:hypothetical protein
MMPRRKTATPRTTMPKTTRLRLRPSRRRLRLRPQRARMRMARERAKRRRKKKSWRRMTTPLMTRRTMSRRPLWISVRHVG